MTAVCTCKATPSFSLTPLLWLQSQPAKLQQWSVMRPMSKGPPLAPICYLT